MKDAFKTHAKMAATDFNRETAMRLIKPTLLRQPIVAQTFHLIPPRLRAAACLRIATFSEAVYMSTVLSGLESFTDPKLINLLDRFMTPGWKAETSDYAGGDAPNRDYRFTRKCTWDHDKRSIGYKKLIKEEMRVPDTFDIVMTISAWVKEDSPTCRIVTKEHEETIKKVDRFIVCE